MILKKKKMNQINKIRNEKKDIKLLLENIKEEQSKDLNERKKKIEKDRMYEFDRIKNSQINFINKNKEFYKNCMTEVKKNRAKIKKMI